MEDAALVRQVAAEYLRWFGTKTQEHLRGKVDRALALGDELSAEVWSDIATSAAEQFKGFRLDRDLHKKLINIAAVLCSDWITHGINQSLGSMTSMLPSQLFESDMVISLSMVASFGG